MLIQSSCRSLGLYSSAVRLSGAIALCAAALSTSAVTITIYDENVTKVDLSNDAASPTQLTVFPGINEVYGTMGASGGDIDREYFTFTVPAGYELVAIAVRSGTEPLPPGGLSFFGVQAGNTITVDPAGPLDDLLGYVEYNASNGNILPDLSKQSGLTPPWHAGAYAFWLQEPDEGTSPYGFAFQIERAVPDAGPGLWSAFAAMGSLLAFGGRRRS